MAEKIEPDYKTVLKALGAVSEVEYDKLYNLLSDTQQKWKKTIKDKKRLQEQLNEANELLNLYVPKKRINSVCVKPINYYKTKWGVK
jgi:hypothetical protein